MNIINYMGSGIYWTITEAPKAIFCCCKKKKTPTEKMAGVLKKTFTQMLTERKEDEIIDSSVILSTASKVLGSRREKIISEDNPLGKVLKEGLSLLARDADGEILKDKAAKMALLLYERYEEIKLSVPENYKNFTIIKDDECILKFKQLDPNQKNLVYGKIWELGKLKDCRISGENWGEENALKDLQRLAKALHRLGFLGEEGLAHMPCLSLSFGTGGLEPQYFSLGEKMDQDPKTGEIGLVNGIGYQSLEKAGKDASIFSDSFGSGKNIHCIYMPTYGLLQDLSIVKAVDGGRFVKTTYLIVQQWVDFLDSNPEKKYLQIGYSGGGAQVNAALRFTQNNRSDLLQRIRVMTVCSAHLILPISYPGIQVVNLFKKNDMVVIPAAVNADCIDNPKYAQNLKAVAHKKGGDPHDYLAEDYVREGQPYVNKFIESGNLY